MFQPGEKESTQESNPIHNGQHNKSLDASGGRGENTSSGAGVKGESTSLVGVYGESTNFDGVQGRSANSAGVYGYSSTNYAGYFAGTGNVHLEGTLTQNSDVRLKQDINTLNYGLAEVLRLHPVTWRWKDHPERGPQLGLVAQEVEPVLPELVSTVKNAGQTKGLNYTGLLPVLVKAIQEQQQQLEQQQAQTEGLQRQVSQQQQLIQQQQKQVEALMRMVCKSNPNEEICKP